MFTTDELKRSKLCCALGERDLARFAEMAADVRLAPGEWLIREGEPPWFFVLFEGKLRMVKEILGRQQNLFEYEYGVGDFFGETPILLGTQALVSLRAETHCRVARLERMEFQNLIRDSKEASAMILQTMNDRLMRAQKYATTVPSSRVLILGTRYDTDCRDIRAFLAANRIPFEFVDREFERKTAGIGRRSVGDARISHRPIGARRAFDLGVRRKHLDAVAVRSFAGAWLLLIVRDAGLVLH